MKAAYFNCIGGVSGDMVLGALVDTGLSIDSLRTRFPSSVFRVTISKPLRTPVPQSPAPASA